MSHWFFDETTMVQRMREVQRQADRAQRRGLVPKARSSWWRRYRTHLGQRLVTLGQRLQQKEPVAGTNLASTSQCGLR
jgi:hypothetical protein